MAQKIFLITQVIIHRIKSPQLIIEVGQIPFDAPNNLTTGADDAEFEDDPRWIKLICDAHLIGLRPASWLEIASQIDIGDSDI